MATETPRQELRRLRKEKKAREKTAGVEGKTTPKSKPLARPVPGVTGAAASGDDFSGLIGTSTPKGAGAEFGRSAAAGAFESFVAAPGQVVADIQDSFNPGARRRFDEAAQQTISDIRGVPGESLELQDIATVGKFVGQTAPALAIPAARATRAGRGPAAFGPDRFTGQIAAGTGTGVVFGGTQFLEESQSRIAEAAKGGALGFAITAPPAVIEGTKNAFKRTIGKLFDDPQVKKNIRFEKATGIEQTTGEQTMNQTLLELEQAAAGSKTAAKLRVGQAIKTVSNLRNIMRAFREKGLSAADIGRRAQKVLKVATKQMREHRGAKWDEDMAPIDELVGNQGFVDPTDILNVLDAEIAKISPRVAEAVGPRATLLKKLKKMREGFAGESGKDLMNVVDVKDSLSLFGAAARGSEQLFSKKAGEQNSKRIGVLLTKALNKSLDDAQANPQLGEAVEVLRKARANWSNNSARIDELGDSVLGQFLGGKVKDMKLETVAKKIFSMENQTIRTTMKLVRDRDPDLANAISRRWVQDALKKSEVSDAPVGAFPYDISKVLKEINKGGKIRSIMESGPERTALFQTLQTLRVIQQRAVKAASAPGSTQLAREAAGGAVSLGSGNASALIFVARTLASIAPERMARVLMTPSGRAAIRVFREKAPGRQRVIAALAQIQLINQSPDELSGDNNEQE